jgi:ABC-2 type transport system permease protein
MKTIYKVARTELALLFYSPIAWFLLVAFTFQCGLTYTTLLDNYLTMQDIGGYNLKFLTFLTRKLFGPPYSLFPGMAGKLYLYLPLLTMGLMSREINSGTIKLLYSSPVKVREIIFGKFGAMMVYNLLLVAILALLAVTGIFNIRAADTGMMMAGLLGMYLLLCTYAAIGLFMSCLTSYQVVAALSTLVLLGVLSYIGSMWQDIDFVRDLAYFLSINGRAEHMFGGLITTKDVLYFVLISAVFLVFSIYKLQGDRESRPLFVKVARYAGVVVVALAIGYITARPGFIGYWDTTATKTNTLTVNSQKIVKEMDAPLEVTSYINLLDNRFFYGRPEERNQDMARWEPYLRFVPGIKFRYVYYYDSTADKNLFKYNPGMTLKALAEKYAKSDRVDMGMFKIPAEIRREIDLRPEQNRYVMQLRYKDRTTFLRLFDDMQVFPSETETDAALKRLQQAKLPKIAFLQGELERSIDKLGDRHYKVLTNDIPFRYSLINQGFDVETVSAQDGDIPTDIAALVIADPKAAFDTVTLNRLKAYIASGGNLLIAGEPGKQAILEPLLQPLGVQMMEGQLVEKTKEFSPELVQPYLTPAAAALTKGLKQAASDSLVVSMRGASGLSWDTGGVFTVTPLLMTNPKTSWNKKVRPNEDEMESAEDAPSTPGFGMSVAVAGGGASAGRSSMQSGASTGHRSSMTAGTAMAAETPQGLTFDPSQGDQKGPLPTAVGLTRMVGAKQQRIVVVGDADFLSNAELSRSNLRTCNFDFSTALFSWFDNGEFPIETSRPPSEDNHFNLTSNGLTMLKWFYMGILPGVLLVFAAILLVRRKRK